MHWSNLKSFGRGAKLLAAAIVYLWSVSAHAADPVYCASDADIVLTTKAEVDTFQEVYGPCDTTLYGLRIGNLDDSYGAGYSVDRCESVSLGYSGNSSRAACLNARIFDLGGLSGLNHIQGAFEFRGNPHVTDASGLSLLERVDGDVHLSDNDALESWGDGLSKLAEVSGSLYVSGNAKLTSLLLGHLPGVGDKVVINNNDALSEIDLTGITSLTTLLLTANNSLVDVSGFANLGSLSDSLYVRNNASLDNLGGLSKLTVVPGGVYINGNPRLSELGLSGLAEVQGDIELIGNAGVGRMSLAGLEALSTVGGSLTIKDNRLLYSLDGLTSLEMVGGSFVLQGNPSLPDVHGLLALASVAGDLSATGNGALRDCSGLSTVLGWGAESSGVGGGSSISNASGCSSVDEVLSFSGTLAARPSYCVTPEKTVLTTKAEVDTFQEVYGPCDTTLYGLRIGNLDDSYGAGYSVDRCESVSLGYSGNSSRAACLNARIFDLGGLSGLNHIQGAFEFRGNPHVTDASGLSLLERVDGDVHLSDNDALESWGDGLSKLAEVSGSLYVSGNAKLTSLLLGHLPGVGDKVVINNNDALSEIDLTGITSLTTLLLTANNSLVDVSGFANLGSLSDSLYVRNNASLDNLGGLSKLTVVPGGVYINGNPRLSELGLSGLAEVQGDIELIGNAGVGRMSLAGLEALSTVGGSLTIKDNRLLYSLDGLTSLEMVGGSFVLQGNPSLPDVHGLLALASVAGDLSATGNGALRDCSGLSTVLGWGAESSGVGGGSSISNASGCSSVDEVLSFSGTLAARPSYCVTPEKTVLTTKAEVDTFQEVYGPCDTTLYGLRIGNLDDSYGAGYSVDRCESVSLGYSGNSSRAACLNARIFDLGGLSGLNHIQGAFEFRGNPHVTDASGLSLLERVDGDVHLSDNDALESWGDGLSKLAEVSGSLYVSGNAKLTSLLLGHLPGVGDKVDINNNDALSEIDLTGITSLTTLLLTANNSLVDVSGFANLGSLSDSLYVRNNASLDNLGGLSKLTVVPGGVYINGNPRLSELGLSGLAEVQGDIELIGNAGVGRMSLAGLEALSTVGGSLTIKDNRLLYSLDGLTSLEMVGGSFVLQGNPSLPDVHGLLALASVAGDLSATGNGALRDCSGLSTVLGWGAESSGVGGGSSISNASGCSSVDEVLSFSGTLAARPSYCVTPEKTVLTTKAEVDTFQEVYGPCDTTLYGLRIGNLDDSYGAGYSVDRCESVSLGYSGNSSRAACLNARIFDLGGLSGLNHIQGAFEFRGNPHVTDASGLSLLERVDGDVHLSDNDALESWGDGLSKLAEVSGSLYVSGNAKLTSLLLGHLPGVGDKVDINNNDALSEIDLTGITSLTTLLLTANNSLVDVSGFANLGSLSDSLYVRNNASLDNLGGLSKLTVVPGGVYINGNPRLSELGLSGLAEVQGDIELIGNAGVGRMSLAGLEALSTVGGSLTIKDNRLLYSLDGLTSLEMVGGSFVLQGNPSLPDVHGLLALASVAGDLSATGNGALRDCSGLSTVLGWGAESSGVGGGSSISNASGCSSVDEVLSFSGTLAARPSYCVTPEKTVLTTKAEVDTFQEVYGPCDTTLYGLRIGNLDDSYGAGYSVDRCESVSLGYSGNSSRAACLNARIFDLGGLSGLNHIQGAFEFRGNPHVTDASGLSLLERVDGDVHLSDNDALESWGDGLSKLAEVSGSLYVSGNAKLTSLLLGHLPGVGDKVDINNNDALSEIDLTGITSLTTLLLTANNSLVDVSGFANLGSLSGSLYVRNNSVA